HGYSATSRMWTPQVRGLADRFRLILWDIRGHGESDSPDDPAAYSEEASVGDMAAILDACGVDRATVGGLSLGGYLSLAFHLRHPARVRALMLFDTGPGYRSDEGRKRWNALAESYARGLEERGLAALGAGAEVRAAQHRSALGLVFAARGILAQRDARVIDSLPAIRVPTLVLWGERDEPFVKPGEYMAAKIPGARRAVVPGAGHAANLDQPAAFDAAVAGFLGSLES
ncbi:MAG: alpha/beta fold hydrolase, partial [Candidatus Binatia bacterium]